MNRKLTLCLLFLLLPTVACALGPKIEVDETDFNFGTVLQGERVVHSFTFHNAGDEPLRIERVKSSCGCTAVLLSDKEIPPGGDGQVKATFDSTRFRGGVVKTIYLYSNDPARSLVQLHLRGMVQEEISLSSRSLVIGPLAPGERSQAELTLTNRSRTPVTIGPVRTTARELTVDLEPTSLAPGQSLTLEIIARPGKGRAVVSGYLLIRTDNSRLPEIRVPVRIRVATQKN